MVDLNGLSSGRVQPSLIPALVEGLDLSRCVLSKALGVFMANPTATFVSGQFVSRDANGQIVLCTGSNPMGLAKWNKTNQMFGVRSGESIVLTGVAAIPLKHPLVAAVLVTNLAGAAYVVTTDYTVNATNGTITRVSGGGIADGENVLVSYRFSAQSSDLDFNGRNFFNFLDDTITAQGRIAVVQGPATVFSAAYDSSKVYAVNDSIYVGTDGFPTNTTNGAAVGKVIQAPTPDDPYLGFDLNLVA